MEIRLCVMDCEPLASCYTVLMTQHDPFCHERKGSVSILTIVGTSSPALSDQ